MPTPVSLYPDADGALSVHRTEGATAVPFELADGYRVGPGFTGVLAIFGRPGTLGMTLEDALRARMLRPVFDSGSPAPKTEQLNRRRAMGQPPGSYT